MEKLIDRVLQEQTFNGERQAGLVFSCPLIEIEVESGQKIAGSFKIVTDQKYKPEGYVYCNDIRMYVKTSFFRGLEQEVFYSYNSEGLESGETYEGSFSIVSNLGEYKLPYRINVTSKYPITSLGSVKNLFHFANLAQSHWDEAMELFYSKQFPNILNGNDSQYISLYRGLSYDSSNAKNMDEFLQITKKKTRMSFSVDRDSFTIEKTASDKTYSINIAKDGWGIEEISVETEGGFIFINEDKISLHETEGNTYTLNFSIDAKCLHFGKNEGKIIIKDFFDSKEINVIVNNHFMSNIKRDEKVMLRYNLTKYYIDYRLGVINKTEWLKLCGSVVGRCIQSDPNDIETRLYQVQMLYAEKRQDDADKILERVNNMLENVNNPELLGYYYYLKFLGCKDRKKIEELCHKTELLYVQNISSFRLAYIILHMKPDYIENEELSWEVLKKQYEYGANSPIIYILALQLLLKNPSILNELGDFEISFLTFAMRHNALKREIRNRFVFLCSKLVAYSREVYYLLKCCYDSDPKDETLSEICRLLMKGNKIGKEYFEWYEKAVEMELRINRLYEYYVMSIDMDFKGELPKLVLMYFAYRSNLNYERNAFLYANVLHHKAAYQDIYNDYYPTIENFAKEQLAKRRISKELAFIYETVLGDKISSSEYATLYASICFINRIVVTNPDICKVIVRNDHMINECAYNIYNLTVDVPLLPFESYIFLEDKYGNRYADENLYQKECIVSSPVNIEETMENSEISILPAIYLADLCEDGLRYTKRNEQALLWIIGCEEVDEEYRREVTITLLNNYFENDEISRLDEILSKIDPYMLTAKDREICVKILVARGWYDRAFEIVKLFGPEQIDLKILVRLCDRMLARTDYEYDYELLKICEWIFENSRYDEEILKYMVMYSETRSTELKNLWRAADSFGMDARRILELMLVQILYSGAEIGEESNIFLEYIALGANNKLEICFLEKLAYDYFVKEKKVDAKVFERVNYHHQLDEGLSDYCYLAYLKMQSEFIKNGKLDTKERAIIEIYLRNLLERNIFLPFFMGFVQIYPSLEIYRDRQYVEYRGNENSKAVIHYVFEENNMEQEYYKDEMIHVIGGIFIKSFILFDGDKIKYYITEEGARQEKLTKSDVLESDCQKVDNPRKRFDVINSIKKNEGDVQKAISMIEEYDKKSFLVKNIFDIEILM